MFWIQNANANGTVSYNYSQYGQYFLIIAERVKPLSKHYRLM